MLCFGGRGYTVFHGTRKPVPRLPEVDTLPHFSGRGRTAVTGMQTLVQVLPAEGISGFFSGRGRTAVLGTRRHVTLPRVGGILPFFNGLDRTSVQRMNRSSPSHVKDGMRAKHSLKTRFPEPVWFRGWVCRWVCSVVGCVHHLSCTVVQQGFIARTKRIAARVIHLGYELVLDHAT